MTVRVGQSWSDPREVFGGAPQGSILGVMLFNCSTDDLEHGSPLVRGGHADVVDAASDESFGALSPTLPAASPLPRDGDTL